MSEPTDDGGPFPLDSNQERFNMTVCEKFTLQLEALPPFLSRIMPALPPANGGWERTVTFTAKEQTLRALVACFIALSQEQKQEKKFIIAMAINWTTAAEISKERRHQITRNSTILGRWLKETGRADGIPLTETVCFAGTISLRIQTIEEGRYAAGSDAPSCERFKQGLRSALAEIPKIPEFEAILRDYFAAHALESDIHAHKTNPNPNQPNYTREQARYFYADAMITQRTKN